VYIYQVPRRHIPERCILYIRIIVVTCLRICRHVKEFCALDGHVNKLNKLKYMKLLALLALRKCDPKNHRALVGRNGDIFAINRCLMSPILAVSILQVVDTGTEMLGVGIEKNAKYR